MRAITIPAPGDPEALQLTEVPTPEIGPDEVLVRAKEVAATRDRFAADLRDLGFDVPDAQGNYVWIALDDDAAAAFEDACAAQAVAIRKLKGGVRVSIGADEALDRVRAVAAEFAAGR